MTPKKKAKLLFNMYNMILEEEKSKQCALITVNELINSKTLDVEFWIKTKKEIQKL